MPLLSRRMPSHSPPISERLSGARHDVLKHFRASERLRPTISSKATCNLRDEGILSSMHSRKAKSFSSFIPRDTWKVWYMFSPEERASVAVTTAPAVCSTGSIIWKSVDHETFRTLFSTDCVRHLNDMYFKIVRFLSNVKVGRFWSSHFVSQFVSQFVQLIVNVSILPMLVPILLMRFQRSSALTMSNDSRRINCAKWPSSRYKLDKSAYSHI